MMIKQLMGMPKLKLENIEYINNNVQIIASCKSKRCGCPVCGKYSNTIHGYYTRTITDLLVFQSRTIIGLHTRKFKCKNKKCSRKVFSEQSPYILRYSRKTIRATKILELLSIELTGNLGSFISKQLLLTVSNSTLIRMAHNQLLPEIQQSKVLGIDDWAYRKGVSYGTILIDMETSKPIDILESRESKDLKTWLLKYPDIEIVTQDRASSYSCAVKEVCPKAVQVADRFHLYMNLSDALDKYFKSIRLKIRTLIKKKTNEILSLPEGKQVNNEDQIGSVLCEGIHEFIDVKFDQRLDIFNKVKEFQAQGVPIRKIGKNLDISRNTVRSYFMQESLSPRAHSKSTNIELFTNHIVNRLNVKGYKIKDIIEEINELGFTGGRAQAYYNINSIKENFKINTPNFSQVQQTIIPFVKPLNSRKLAKYVGSCLAEITDQDERNYLKTLLANISELQVVRKLVQTFKNMLKTGRGNIKRWIEIVKRKFHGLKSFANGLTRDIEAVENGIQMTWSNGAVEGHVNRIKNIKRQMYGRAGFDLLRKKVILSQSG